MINRGTWQPDDRALTRPRSSRASPPFESIGEVEPLAALIGQPRVLDAISFGVEMDGFGYNFFLAGAPGSGRMETIRTTWPVHTNPAARR